MVMSLKHTIQGDYATGLVDYCQLLASLNDKNSGTMTKETVQWLRYVTEQTIRHQNNNYIKHHY